MITRVVIEANKLLFEKLNDKSCSKSNVYQNLDPVFRLPAAEDGLEQSLDEEDYRLCYNGLNQFLQQIKHISSLSPDKWQNAPKEYDGRKLNIRLFANSLLAVNVFSALGIDFSEFMQEVRDRVDMPVQPAEADAETEFGLIMDRLDELSGLVQEQIRGQRKENVSLQERILFIHSICRFLSDFLSKNEKDGGNAMLQSLVYYAGQLERYIPRQTLIKKIIRELKPKNEAELKTQLYIYLIYMITVIMIDILDKIESLQDTAVEHMQNAWYNKALQMGNLPLKQKRDEKAAIVFFSRPQLISMKNYFNALEKQTYTFLSFLENFKGKNVDGKKVENCFSLMADEEQNELLCILKQLSHEITGIFGNRKTNLSRSCFKGLKDLQNLLKGNSLFNYSFDLSEASLASLESFSVNATEMYGTIKKRIETSLIFSEPYELSPIQIMAQNFIFSAWKKKIREKMLSPIIALDMGVGKTVVASSAIKRFIENYGNTVTYILLIVPASLIANWKETLEKYRLGTIIEMGQNREKYIVNGKLHFGQAQVFITSYDMAGSDWEIYQKTPPSLIVYDELQTTNTVGLLDKCINLAGLNASVQYKFALTGTPVQNNTGEFFTNYCFFHNKALLRKAKTFIDSGTGDFDWEQEETKDVKELLKANQFYFFGRNTSSIDTDIKFIPLKIEGRHLDNYTRMESLEWSDQECSQYLLCPQIFKEDEKFKKFQIDVNIESAKMAFVKTLIAEIPKNEKIIIFSYYKEPLHYLEGELSSYNPALVIGSQLDGDKNKIENLSENNRTELERFKDNPECRVLLSTIKKSGVGENLQSANHLVILDLWWNPMVVFQAMYRIIRKGQQRKAHVYLPIYMKISGNIAEALDYEKRHWETMKGKVENFNNFLADIGQQDGQRKFPDKALSEILSFERTSEGNEKWLLDKLHQEGMTSAADCFRSVWSVEEANGSYSRECIVPGGDKNEK